jgi:hypothetical protein
VQVPPPPPQNDQWGAGQTQATQPPRQQEAHTWSWNSRWGGW